MRGKSWVLYTGGIPEAWCRLHRLSFASISSVSDCNL